MKKRVIGSVALLLAVSLITYLWPKHPPDDVLVRMGEILSELEELYDGDEVVSISPLYTDPDDLDAEKVNFILRKLREAGLDGASFGCSEEHCLSVYSINKGFRKIGRRLYYKYDSKDLVEEWIVDSVEKAIEENTSTHYAFCERTEVEHWFYCENNH